MKRKEAKDYYFFDDDYFNKIMEFYDGRFIISESIFEGKIIASGLYFITDKNVHAHLSGTDTEYLDLSPAYILKYATALWAKENGYNYIHYGGGTTAALDNSLYMFKCKFSKNTRFEFWIGKRIWNPNIYNRLCEKVGVSKYEEFFPAYRKGM